MSKLRRRLANSSPIKEETPQEHVRNAQMMLREALEVLDNLPPSGTPGYFRVSGTEFETIRESLEGVDRRLSFAILSLEHRSNPPVSESGALDEISTLLKQVRVKDESDHQLVKEIAFIVGQLRMQVRLGQHTNTPSKKAKEFISKKIALLAHEGVAAPKRIAEAYAIARQRGFRGISLPARGRKGRLRSNPATLAVLGLNPPVRIDESVDPIEGLWGEIHYVRPDDPDGEVVRVHEFEAGFRAFPLTDGRVLLESRQNRRLWTVE